MCSMTCPFLAIPQDVEEISTKYWDYVAEDIFNIWKRMESHPEVTIIGASQSEPHTSVIALRVACVCTCVCLFACGHIPEI